jgi:hypothetical protein
MRMSIVQADHSHDQRKPRQGGQPRVFRAGRGGVGGRGIAVGRGGAGG